jgi:hypothetical protein
LYYVLICAVIGFVIGASLAPSGGARYTEQRWSDSLFGLSGFTFGAVGAGLGLVAGLFLASRHPDPRRGKPLDRQTTQQAPEGPREARRRWLRLRRKRDAPKRFGKRGR